MLHSRPTLAFNPLIPLPPTSYFFPLHPHHRLMFLAVFLYLLLFPTWTPSGFFNGMLEVSESGALNYYKLFGLILLALFVSWNLISIHLALSGFLDSLLRDLIAPASGLAISLPIQRTSAATSSFSSGRAYPSLNFLPLFLRLTPTLIM